MNLGERIKQLRTQRDWTQPQLAEAMGIEQSYLSKLENDKSTPSADIFQLLLAAFGLNTRQMLEGVDDSVVHRQLRQIPEVANHLNQREASNHQHKRNWLIFACLASSLGIVMFVSGYNALIFPTVHFNYESRGIVLEGESKEVFYGMSGKHFSSEEEMRAAMRDIAERQDEEYLLLDEYRGDIFSLPVEGGSRTYRLNGQREVDRAENRYLQITGLMLFLFGLSGFYLQARLYPSNR